MPRPTYPHAHPRQQAGEAKYSREDAASELYRLFMIIDTGETREAVATICTLEDVEQLRRVSTEVERP